MGVIPKILISYRREDSAPYAGRLFDRLSGRYGRDNVFIDVDAIKPGQDFVRSISATVIACDALVAVIGKQWLAAADASGARRLDRADDLLRIELAAAFARGVPVLPVLVGGAVMPEPGDLPADLAKLGRIQALTILDTDFDDGYRSLLDAVEAAAPTSKPSPAARTPVARLLGGAGRWGWGVVAAIVVVVAALAVWELRDASDSGSTLGAPGSGPAVEASSQRGSSTSLAVDGAPELLAGAAPPVRALADPGTIDRPTAVDAGVTYGIVLEPNETAFFALSKPVSDLLLVMDMRSSSGQLSSLNSEVSFLDGDGATIVKGALDVSKFDWAWRSLRAASFGRRPIAVTLKLVNGAQRNAFWLTPFDERRAPFVPFFGEVSPRALAVDRVETGEMDVGEDLYFRVALRKGTYRVVADLTNVPRERTIISGYVALLDPFGAEQSMLIEFSEFDFSYRHTATLPVARDGPAILRLQNSAGHRSGYSLRVMPVADAAQ